jgi:hypothetical protein
MNETHTAVVSLLLDGEPVDPDALAGALEDSETRAALVDFVRLRRGLNPVSATLPPSLQALRRRPVPRVAIRWVAAAALLVLVFLAGWIAPRPFSGHSPDPGGSPPVPVRVEKFEPGVDWSVR